MTEFEIFFHDLNEDAQKRLLEAFETTVTCENWDSFPITTICREDDEDEASMERILEMQSDPDVSDKEFCDTFHKYNG